MSEAAIHEFEATRGGEGNQAATHVQHVLRLKDLGARRILDFGCGFGQFLEVCRLFGLEAAGVDRSSARRSGAAVPIYPTLDEVPGTFDAITMFEVLEHLDDPLSTLETLRARLNPSGHLIVEVPDTSGVSSIVDRESYYKIHPLDHINAFTPNSLEQIMAKAGFSPIRKEAAFVTTSPTRVLKELAKGRLRQVTTQRYFRLR
jgi:SAM-dependent methyltransferase